MQTLVFFCFIACDLLTTERQFSILHQPVLESILTYAPLWSRSWRQWMPTLVSFCFLRVTSRQSGGLLNTASASLGEYTYLCPLVVAFVTPINADARLLCFLRVISRQSGSFQYYLGQSWRVYLLMSPCSRVRDANKCRRLSPFAFCVWPPHDKAAVFNTASATLESILTYVPLWSRSWRQ